MEDVSRMKKLIYVLHDIKTGGVEVALLSAVPKLNKQFKLRIIVLGDIDDMLLGTLTSSERQVFYKFNFSLLLYPLIIPYLIIYILKLKPDIIVSSLWRGSMLGMIIKIFKPRVKYFAFIHNTRFFHRLDAFFTIKAIEKADVVLTDSSSSSEFVEKLKSGANSRIISFLTNETPILLKELFLEKGTRIKLVFLGRLNPVKNVPLAIKSIKYLRERGLNVTLDIYGRDDGSLKDVVSAISSNKLEQFVTIKGEISPSERFVILNEYHGLVQFSINEGMAMSIVEAMQYGLICFVTPVGEIPNYSKDLISAVHLVFSDNSSTNIVFSKMKNVLDDQELCKRLSFNAQKTFKNRQIFADSLIQELL